MRLIVKEKNGEKEIKKHKNKLKKKPVGKNPTGFLLSNYDILTVQSRLFLINLN
jgi:hypothetical protein